MDIGSPGNTLKMPVFIGLQPDQFNRLPNGFAVRCRPRFDSGVNWRIIAREHRTRLLLALDDQMARKCFPER